MIFVVAFIALGTALMVLVNSYEINEKTNLLKENATALSENISEMLIVNDMNSSYSPDKALICDSLRTVSNCIDADVFVCDVGGNVIICKEQTGIGAYATESMVCDEHAYFKMDDTVIQSVYEDSISVSRSVINGKNSYVVGVAIVAPQYSQGNAYEKGDIIGSVFAVVEVGATSLVSSVTKAFLVIAVVVLLLAFAMIWLTTRKMVTPLQQMSQAAKRFAVGDFSYRVEIDSNDELSDLGIAFNDMADALDKLESSRRSFVANVSHELKTPMTSISGFIDGILDGTIPKEKETYYLKIVSDEIKRLSRLVVAMLNMSKMESGDFEMKPKNYNISDQIIHILLTFEQNIEKKNIEIRGLEDMPPHRVHADPDMIYQVIYNIFDNAVKFTNTDGYIDIKVKEKSDIVEISVKNSGEGIKPDELTRVFERFYKVDKSRSLDAKGAGLGLYIVKMMVEMHGGKIFARSDSENEAEFVFTLPKGK
ncbi:MAG: HAMP domain-containing histidine kinase [Eubacterium sp.]|nr:HAMP domain-containing histidine kinase [Eubacterium sp.]